MGEGMPITPEVFELICGLGAPCEPGIHGPVRMEAAPEPAIEFATKIRDLCDDFICNYGKGEEGESDDVRPSVQERGKESSKDEGQDSEQGQDKPKREGKPF